MLHRLAVLLVALALLLPLPALAAAQPTFRQDTDADLMPDAVQTRIDEIKNTITPLVSTFNTDDGAWDTESDEDITRSFEPGVYHLRNDTTQTIGWSMYDRTAADFYAEVDTYQVAGTTDNEFGILFRHADDDNYWVFSIASDGRYRLDKQVDNEWVTVSDWIEASAINTGDGSHNVIGLLVEGRKIAMLVNGDVLSAVTDNFAGGDGLGVSVGTHDEGGVEVAFEDFRLWPIGATGDNGENGDNGEVTPEPTPEASTAPDPTLIQRDVEPIRGNRPDYQDDFRRASDRWPTSSDDQGAVAFADRGLNITIDAPNYALWTANQEVAALTPGGPVGGGGRHGQRRGCQRHLRPAGARRGQRQLLLLRHQQQQHLLVLARRGRPVDDAARLDAEQRHRQRRGRNQPAGRAGARGTRFCSMPTTRRWPQ